MGNLCIHCGLGDSDGVMTIRCQHGDKSYFVCREHLAIEVDPEAVKFVDKTLAIIKAKARGNA